jgi:hypothetical protein
MKTFILQIVSVMGVALIAASATFAQVTTQCQSGTLQTYTSQSCAIGTTLFTNFEYSETDTGNSLAASEILVTPIAMPENPGFVFSVNSASATTWLLGTGKTYAGKIRITLQIQKITGQPTISAQQATLTVNGGQFEGGTLSVTGSGCLGALGICTQPRPLNSGTPVNLGVVSTPGTSVAYFPGLTGTVDLTIDLNLQGPTSGTALTGFTTFSVQYAMVP